ncbi:MAG: hypothetical protein K2L81_02260 [Muribaculaceae bacterium]|nr:hypothetical protein [Muribaculaceae bacterium]
MERCVASATMRGVAAGLCYNHDIVPPALSGAYGHGLPAFGLTPITRGSVRYRRSAAQLSSDWSDNPNYSDYSDLSRGAAILF